jgi:hypothetical protein
MQLSNSLPWDVAGQPLSSTNGESRQRHYDSDTPPFGTCAQCYPIPPGGHRLRFYISSFNPSDVLNSTIIGPKQQPVMHVITDPQMPGYTIFKNARGESIALIEWQIHPMVEVHGATKRRVKDWMKLSADKS